MIGMNDKNIYYRSIMITYNSLMPNNNYKNVSDFILDTILYHSSCSNSNPLQIYSPYADADPHECWVIVKTNTDIIRCSRDRLDNYVDNDNDCISIKLGKRCFKLIPIDDILGIEYEDSWARNEILYEFKEMKILL